MHVPIEHLSSCVNHAKSDVDTYILQCTWPDNNRVHSSEVRDISLNLDVSMSGKIQVKLRHFSTR